MAVTGGRGAVGLEDVAQAKILVTLHLCIPVPILCHHLGRGAQLIDLVLSDMNEIEPYTRFHLEPLECCRIRDQYAGLVVVAQSRQREVGGSNDPGERLRILGEDVDLGVQLLIDANDRPLARLGLDRRTEAAQLKRLTELVVASWRAGGHQFDGGRIQIGVGKKRAEIVVQKGGDEQGFIGVSEQTVYDLTMIPGVVEHQLAIDFQIDLMLHLVVNNLHVEPMDVPMMSDAWRGPRVSHQMAYCGSKNDKAPFAGLRHGLLGKREFVVGVREFEPPASTPRIMSANAGYWAGGAAIRMGKVRTDGGVFYRWCRQIQVSLKPTSS